MKTFNIRLNVILIVLKRCVVKRKTVEHRCRYTDQEINLWINSRLESAYIVSHTRNKLLVRHKSYFNHEENTIYDIFEKIKSIGVLKKYIII